MNASRSILRHFYIKPNKLSTTLRKSCNGCSISRNSPKPIPRISA